MVGAQEIPAYEKYPQNKTQQTYTDAGKSDKELMEMVRQKIVSRGARGINGIRRVFKIMDDNDSKSLCLAEFTKAMADYRITTD